MFTGVHHHPVLRKPVLRAVAGCRPFSVSQIARLSQTPLPLLGRHRVFPIDLFRVNAGGKVVLHDFGSRKVLGFKEYDLKVHPDNKVHPRLGDFYQGECVLSEWFATAEAWHRSEWCVDVSEQCDIARDRAELS